MTRLFQLILLAALGLAGAARAAADDTTAATIPEFGQMISSNMAPKPATGQIGAVTIDYQKQLDSARDARAGKDFDSSARTLITLLDSDAPDGLKRRALFDLALTTQAQGQWTKAQQIFAQYLHLYPEDPSVPEVLLRQGRLYRDIGVTTLALSKFYSVMSTTLKLNLDDVEYYKSLALQAQTEIADTYYFEGKFPYAVDFYTRIVNGSPNVNKDLNKEQIEWKLIRSLAAITNTAETAGRAESFVKNYTNSPHLAEVRFLYAAALKEMGRNQDSMRQVLLLLQAQQANVRVDPDTWAYWQRRAGNEIANQLYKEGDYVDALQIYLNLAPLDHSIGWQAPVLYQAGLVYEQLQQWPKATEAYDSILSRTNEFTNASPAIQSLVDMTKWRKEYIGWMQRARATNAFFQVSLLTNTPATTVK